MSEKKQNTPMYFASLEIENVKCFGEKQTLDLRDKTGAISPWTLILGDNGIGKTTLLKCLAWMKPVEEIDKDRKGKITAVAIKPLMDDFEHESEYEQLIKDKLIGTSRIGAILANNVKLGKRPKPNNLISHAIKIITTPEDSDKAKKGELDKIEPEFGELEEFNTLNIYAYSAGRHVAFKNSDKKELQDPMSNLFSEKGDLYDAEELLAMLDNASIRQKGKGKATELLKKVKEILSDILPDIANSECILINSPINEDGSINETLVEVKTSNGKVKLFDLSLGYRTMLAWTVDLAVRMLWRNPDSKHPLKEPAVVIVDEIDLHLHPKWQRTIRKHLTFHFPNTQFICTAHSPFMAQSSELENLCVINQVNGEIHIENEPYVVKGWRIGQIVTSDLFGIADERSEDIEELMIQRRVLLNKRELTIEDESKLNELNEALSHLPIYENNEDQKILEKIQKTVEFLKKEVKLHD